jgi:hypothetical protein
MEKPISLSVKDWLIRRLAVKLMVSENVLDAVVTHQFQSANEALTTNKSVEISGFGKFFFNHKKVAKRLVKLESQIDMFTKKSEDMSIPEQRREGYKVKLRNALATKQSLKPKIDNEYQSDLRGVEEQVDSTI